MYFTTPLFRTNTGVEIFLTDFGCMKIRTVLSFSAKAHSVEFANFYLILLYFIFLWFFIFFQLNIKIIYGLFYFRQFFLYIDFLVDQISNNDVLCDILFVYFLSNVSILVFIPLISGIKWLIKLSYFCLITVFSRYK